MDERYKVLLVEDSDDDIYLFGKVLKTLPEFKMVAHAETGEEAIEYFKCEGKYVDRDKFPWPDIVVLDLKMPGMNGFQVLEWMRRVTKRPKVGVFTSSGLPEDKAMAERLGADLYQEKTYDPDQFARFMHWLGRLAEAERKGKDDFHKALIGGILVQVLSRCA